MVGEHGQEVLGCRCAGGTEPATHGPTTWSCRSGGKTTHGHCGYHFHFMSNEDFARVGHFIVGCCMCCYVVDLGNENIAATAPGEALVPHEVWSGCPRAALRQLDAA